MEIDLNIVFSGIGVIVLVGSAWNDKGDCDKAIGYYKKALAIVEKVKLPHRVRLVKENIVAMKNQQ